MRIFKRVSVCVLCFFFLFAGSAYAGNSKPGTSIIISTGKSIRLSVDRKVKKIRWISSNKKIATVTSKGKVKAKKKGRTTIRAKVGKRVYSWKVTVVQQVKSLNIKKKNITLHGDGSCAQLTASVKPKNANNKKLLWSSSNTAVATVNQKGKVYASGNGTCYVYAETKDGSKLKVKVKVRVTGLPNSSTYPDVPVSEQGNSQSSEGGIPERAQTGNDLFDLSMFQNELIINDNEMKSLFIRNEQIVDPREITFKLNEEEILEITDFIQLEKEMNPGGFIYGNAYYVGGWEKRIAYVEAGYYPNGFAPFRIDIYPFLSKGAFTIEVYYKDILIAKSRIVMNVQDQRWCQFEDWVRYLEKHAWDNNMTEKEKLDALAEYIRSNTRYCDVDCKTGTQVMFCGAKDLKIDASIAFDESHMKCYDYRSVANMVGHTWCLIAIGNDCLRYDVQGNY